MKEKTKETSLEQHAVPTAPTPFSTLAQCLVSSPIYAIAAFPASLVSFPAQSNKAWLQTSALSHPKEIVGILREEGLRPFYYGFRPFLNRQFMIAGVGGPLENLSVSSWILGSALQAFGETSSTVYFEGKELRQLTRREEIVPESGKLFRQSVRHIYPAALMRNFGMWGAAGYSAEKGYNPFTAFLLGMCAGIVTLPFDNALTRHFGSGKGALISEIKELLAWGKEVVSFSPDARNTAFRNTAKMLVPTAISRALTIGLFTPFMMMAQRFSSKIYEEHVAPRIIEGENVPPAPILAPVVEDTAERLPEESTQWRDKEFVRNAQASKGFGPEY